MSNGPSLTVYFTDGSVSVFHPKHGWKVDVGCEHYPKPPHLCIELGGQLLDRVWIPLANVRYYHLERDAEDFVDSMIEGIQGDPQ